MWEAAEEAGAGDAETSRVSGGSDAGAGQTGGLSGEGPGQIERSLWPHGASDVKDTAGSISLELQKETKTLESSAYKTAEKCPHSYFN